MINLSDVLLNLPDSRPLGLIDGAHRALSLPQRDDGFVEPPLRSLTVHSGPITTPFLLFSAPGAVGKTALARHIAASKEACLWDLSKLLLGDNSFIGTLAQSFGPANLGDILKDLARNRILFVFDAFDEAEILSGWNRIESFLNDLWNYSKASAKPCFVLLARTETAQLLSLCLELLADGSPPYTLFEIDYFDRSRAQQFVAVNLDRLASATGKTLTHRIHPQPFTEAFDSIAAKIVSAMKVAPTDPWNERAIRSFLGYAPVLQAIASYLAPLSNYQDIAKELAAAGSLGDDIQLIESLTARLLEREQAKMVSALKVKDLEEAEGWTGWDALYSPAEQLTRLVLRLTSGADATSAILFPGVPAWLVQAYTDALKAFLPQHPFVHGEEFASPAFRDYTVARMLGLDQFSSRAESMLSHPSYVPTPLFCRFYATANPPPITARHVGYLYESAVSQHGLDDFAETQLWPLGAEAGESVHHQFEVAVNSNGASVAGNVAFEATIAASPTEPVTFLRRIRHAYIYVVGPLRLGMSNSAFELSDVEIWCTHLELRASNLSVRSYNAFERTTIQADQYSQLSPVLVVDNKGPGGLLVSWPEGQRHPWAPYYAESLFQDESDLTGAFLALRRILTWFRRDRKADLARHMDLIDNVAVGGNKMRQAMKDHLLARGILERSAPLYVLNPDRARAHGINWSQLRGGKLTKQLSSFLNEFLASLDARRT